LTLSEPLQTRIRAVSREFNSSSLSPNREGNDGICRRFHVRVSPGPVENDCKPGREDGVMPGTS
jgi:hypothetical protein